MAATTGVLLFVLFVSTASAEECPIFQCDRFDNGDAGKPLYLTPLIGNVKNLKEVKRAARVNGLGDKVESYSGLLTINQEHNSNMFFWFFPATQVDPKTAPVLVWLEGQPASSILFSIFNLNGPFLVDDRNVLRFRQHSWTKTHSMLYFDSPVGTGFSFTASAEGLAKTQEDVAGQLFVAMEQFFQLFPEYRKNELYLGGEFYAGKIVPNLGSKIVQENRARSSPENKMNLKGIIIGNGFTDPASLMDLSDSLYHKGLLGHDNRMHFQLEGERIMQLIYQNAWSEAFEKMDSLFGGILFPSTQFTTVTGLNGLHNSDKDSTPEMEFYREFPKAPCARRSIHVGNLPFDATNKTVFNRLRLDYLRSAKLHLETLLNRGNVSALVYSGVEDLAVPYSNTVHFLSHLHWGRTPSFLHETRVIWREGESAVGYVTDLKVLKHVTLRGVGGHAAFYQPERVFKMINSFTGGNVFSTP